jgi:CheY-like chemotaxis protein
MRTAENIHTVVISSEAENDETLEWIIENGSPIFKEKRVIILAPFGRYPNTNIHQALDNVTVLSKPIRIKEFWRGVASANKEQPKDSKMSSAAVRETPSPFRTSSTNPSHTPEADKEVPNEKPRLLIVEDNKVNQKVLTLMLRSMGYEWEVANNGQEALEALTESHFELVIMDCQMPVMDGFEATRRVRTDGAGINDKDIPIIAMTANAMQGDREKCIAAGMTDYLAKPTRKDQLQKLISRYATRGQPALGTP